MAMWTQLFIWIAYAAAAVAVLTFLGLTANLPTLYAALPVARRRRLAGQLRRIGCGVRVGYVSSLLGSPAFVTTLDENRRGYTAWVLPPEEQKQVEPTTEVVYALKDAYVQLIVDSGGPEFDDRSVLAYAVTTRSRRFRPRPRFGYLHGLRDRRGRPALKLGHTTFAALESAMQTTPEGLAGCLGARRVAYAEAYYFGNSGGYARYVVAFNDAGVRAEAVAFPKLSSAAPGRPAFRIGSFFRQGAQDFGTVREDPTLVAWRRVQIINTYAMLDPTVELQAALAWGFGPDLDRVRFLPPPTGWPAASAPH